MAPAVACIGLGGNVGEAATTIATAARALDDLPRTRLLRLSRLYRTPAWGLREQPDFINGVAMVETMLAPLELLDALLERKLKSAGAIVLRGPRAVGKTGCRWTTRSPDGFLPRPGKPLAGTRNSRAAASPATP